MFHVQSVLHFTMKGNLISENRMVMRIYGKQAKSSFPEARDINLLSVPFRLHGSYEALKYGTLLDGLSDLTGGITESIAIRQDPTACGRALAKLLDMTSLITCTVNNNQQQVSGIVVTQIVREQLVKISN